MRHWTIEGARTSQFEAAHPRGLRASRSLDQAHGGPRRNDHLIGDEVDDWAAPLAEPGAHLHLYGKGEPRPGRKMVHVTR